ncbi:uncharacterized protein C7orf50 homolog [Daktulosphaira vitifoliae]|uniref:uncharacterized protein C7orf50 homolog n=1 Tax=Daktulosphaira vitifoliae TaxID=58002 RepID=UPI0021AA2EA4|nr:uncharacterized protein C7orf50 homolog [Daktulosphaira vitifoliae]
MSVKSILKSKLKKHKPNKSFTSSRKKSTNANTTSKWTENYLKIDPETSITDSVYNCTESGIKLNINENNTKSKCNMVENDSNADHTLKKKKVTFASDVKNDNEKCTAGNIKPLSLNKRKKLNYLKKLKLKKKKEKNAKKQEEDGAASSSRQERAIEYLLEWKNDRNIWKFKKIFQVWLIKNMYDSIKITKEHFDILLEYLQTIKGRCRSMIQENANSIITKYSDKEDANLNSLAHIKYLRARMIIQTCD